MHPIRTATTRLSVRSQLGATAVSERLGEGAQRRLDRLREEPEAGAQAAEYAMLGGVSAAACSVLIYLLKETNALQRVVDSVVTVLTRTVGSWF